ncbi:MAG: class 1 isoprenoid biosynthesis enzyme [Prolixibacteraceae bacterium]|nr:class 1 isoprenoid biosynthesis enzyme [Prolixibacteraceae bacterium]
MIRSYTEKYAEIWEGCPKQLPVFSKKYSRSEKLQKEQTLDQFLKTIKSFRKDRINHQSISEAKQRLFLQNTRAFLCNGLDFTNDQLELMFSDDMVNITRSFVRQAKAFDSELSFSDIFQACRNMWIMNGLQLILGIPMRVTPSIFAYSMLYPYTDNLIDDPQITILEKLAFSQRFRSRLSGVNLNPENKTEHAIFRLVEMIETEYSRTDFPEVFKSLLDIHDAQTASMKLIQLSDSLSEQETLKICLAKGGTSVLADGYLVAGNLTAGQKYFLYGYGAYLQLLDDIQDVQEDFNAGLMTVFSKSAFHQFLDDKLNKTYWFGDEVMKSLDSFDGQNIDLFKSLMRRSMDLFITEAIAQNPAAYSALYSAEFESYSPFYFSYIRKRKEQFTPYNGFLLTAIEEIAFSESMVDVSL